MLSLTGRPLLVLTALAAVVAVAATVAVATGRIQVPRFLARRRGAHGVTVLALVVVAQLLAVSSVALSVNDSYDFYASWRDALGLTSTGGSLIKVGGLVRAGEGQALIRTVHRHPAGRDDQLIVWLPPQYHRPAYRHRRFPVLMFVSGQPSTPHIAFRNFDFAKVASREIATGRMPPFIGVFPTLMVSPPRDTECTDIPGGPQAESWLSHDVPHYLTRHFRADPLGPNWSVTGFSTGGFCSAKLLLAHPGRFSSAASLGGYFRPIQDSTTGSLFRGNRVLQEHNSPLWLYRHGNMHHGRLLVVASRQDHEAWRAAKPFLHLAAGDRKVSRLISAVGGHNYRTYAGMLPRTLQWLSRSWQVPAGA
ncbi:MAG TPA: alpha/beta hydrolase-fold protein [Marmoricola sp.]|nr:alpha/beta hydrolase-fold protein [Marmoricola sp.]